jgi:hypothetical protein
MDDFFYWFFQGPCGRQWIHEKNGLQQKVNKQAIYNNYIPPFRCIANQVDYNWYIGMSKKKRKKKKKEGLIQFQF